MCNILRTCTLNSYFLSMYDTLVGPESLCSCKNESRDPACLFGSLVLFELTCFALSSLFDLAPCEVKAVYLAGCDNFLFTEQKRWCTCSGTCCWLEPSPLNGTAWCLRVRARACAPACVFVFLCAVPCMRVCARI